jgi:hypothetical protein
MHTVDLLERALAAARELGYRVRQEWLGATGGACEIKGQKWLFLDLALSPYDQLQVVAEGLRGDPRLARLALCPELATLLNVRRTA